MGVVDEREKLWDLLAHLNGQLEGLSTVQSEQHRIVLDKLQAEETHHRRIVDELAELKDQVDDYVGKNDRRLRRLEQRDSLRARARRNPDIRSGIIAAIVALATGIGTYLQSRSDSRAERAAAPHAAPAPTR